MSNVNFYSALSLKTSNSCTVMVAVGYRISRIYALGDFFLNSLHFALLSFSALQYETNGWYFLASFRMAVTNRHTVT